MAEILRYRRFEESCVERVVEGLCDLRPSRSDVVVPGGYGVTALGKGKGTGSTIVGVGGSEFGGSGTDGHGGVEGAEVDVDVTLDNVGSGGKSGFGWTFGGHLDVSEVGGQFIDVSKSI